MDKIPLLVLHCFRCDHEWHPRNARRPKVCPVCKRNDWDIPKDGDVNEFTTIGDELLELERAIDEMDKKLERLFDKRVAFYNLRPCRKKVYNISEKLSERMYTDPPTRVRGMTRNERLSIFG